MATYNQYWKARIAEGQVKRITWVCGDQVTLVEEVVDFIRDTLAVSDLDYVSLTGGSTPDKEIWAAANQYPFDPTANRLVLVRDAQRIKNWKPLEAWCEDSRAMPTMHLVFVSAEPDFPYIFGQDGKPTSELKAHVALLRDKNMADLVKCVTPSSEPPMNRTTRRPTGQPSDLVSWVMRQAEMEPKVAEHLLERCGGDLGKAKNVAAKARLFAGSLSTRVVDVLCSESAGDNFSDSLLSGNKARAFAELEAMSPDDYSRTLGLLDSELEVLGHLHAGLRAQKPAHEVARDKGIHPYMARRLWPVAKHYDSAKRKHCRKVLATADEALRGRDQHGTPQPGVMESVITLW